MKKNLRCVLALAMGWLASSTAFAITPVDGVYKIGSSQDWAEFCALHNDGSDQQLNAELTADVAVEGNAMVGINGGGKPFRGTFDGKGHKQLQSRRGTRGSLPPRQRRHHQEPHR